MSMADAIIAPDVGAFNRPQTRGGLPPHHGRGAGPRRSAPRWCALTLSGDQRRPGLGYVAPMATTANDLREEVLAMSVQERARMASDLLASPDSEAVDEAEIDKLWSAETQRRAAMLEAGGAGTLPWDDIQHRFADRRVQRDA